MGNNEFVQFQIRLILNSLLCWRRRLSEEKAMPPQEVLILAMSKMRSGICTAGMTTERDAVDRPALGAPRARVRHALARRPDRRERSPAAMRRRGRTEPALAAPRPAARRGLGDGFHPLPASPGSPAGRRAPRQLSRAASRPRAGRRAHSPHALAVPGAAGVCAGAFFVGRLFGQVRGAHELVLLARRPGQDQASR